MARTPASRIQRVQPPATLAAGEKPGNWPARVTT